MAVQHGKFDIRSTLIYLTGNKTKGKFIDERQKEVQNKCERKYKVEHKRSTSPTPAKKLHTYRHAYWARKPDWAVNWPVS
jgi:hypothetical protein